jgi:hypothetical protein
MKELWRVLVAAAVMVACAPGSLAAAEDSPAVSLAAVHSGLCLQIEGASRHYGAPAQQGPCKGFSHQRMRYDRATGHLVMEHSGMCLEVSNRVISLGAPIWQAPCADGAVLQVFYPSRPLISGEFVAVVVAATRMCLDVAGSSLEEGAAVVQWTCSADSASQVWKVITW